MKSDAQSEAFGRLVVEHFFPELRPVLPLQEGSYVIDDALDVVRGLLQLPDALVDAGQVVKNGEDEGAVDRLSAAGSVLESQFGLAEVDDGFVELLPLDGVVALKVEGRELVREPVWVEEEVPSSLTSSKSWLLVRAISFLREAIFASS